MSANAIIHSASDDYSGEYLTAQAIDQAFTTRIGGPVVIGKHVIIGTAVNIFGPCTLGEGCSVGSMSLIRSDLEPWGVYAGIPARRLKERKRDMLELEKELLAKIALP